MRILIGGGSGFLGRELIRILKGKGHEVTIISRTAGPGRITWEDVEESGLPRCDAAVNLAGENILNPLRRWDESYRRDVFSSRLRTTAALAAAIAKSHDPPRSWVLVSGVACYRPSPDVDYTEESVLTPFDLWSRLVRQWEESARLPEGVATSTRQVIVRSGVVLGPDGGAMKNMLTPFRLGVGGTLGRGHQPFPWIHVSDLAGIVAHNLTPPTPPWRHPEVYNGVAPSLNTNLEFTREMGRVLRRPTLLPVPEAVLNLMLGRERAMMLTRGQRVVPKRTLESEYRYSYPDLSSALQNIILS